MSNEQIELLAADNDRDMLEYLNEGCASQVYVCEQCGHEEPLATFDVASDLRDYMAAYPVAPTAQLQGEPVALPALKELVRACGHDMGGNYEEGQAFGWNACLDEIAKLGPLFTHADAGEVERLRGRVAILEKYETECLTLVREAEEERDTLRARLAEAHALLRESRELLQSFYDTDNRRIGVIHMCRRIDASLSASAEPSAPVERDERAAFEVAMREEGMPVRRHKDGYFYGATDRKWSLWQKAWQARAALERKS